MNKWLSNEAIDTVWDLYPRITANERLSEQAKEANRLREGLENLREYTEESIEYSRTRDDVVNMALTDFEDHILSRLRELLENE